MARLAILGNTSRDRIGGAERIGGGPFHCGRALRAIGVRALLATKLDPRDIDLIGALARLGLPMSCLEGASTSAFSIDYEGETRRMTVDGIGDPWTTDDVRKLSRDLTTARWVHVAGLARGDFPAETLALLARGRRLSLDGQALVRPSRTGPLELDGDFEPAVLEHVSLLKLSEEEAAVLVDLADERSLGQLGVPEIVVTLGSRGAVVFADGLAEYVRGQPADVADPTGAGDAFAAVYVASRALGREPVQAAQRANGLVSSLLAGSAA